MGTRDETRQQTVVVIELAPFLRRFADSSEKEGQAFATHLLHYLRELADDLALPTEVSLEIRESEDEDAFDLTSYRVLVNGCKGRLRLPTLIYPDISALTFARSVARAVCNNRELWVTPALAEQVLRAWSTEDVIDNIPIDGECLKEFYDFLAKLINRCFSINRGQNIVQTLQTRAQEAWRATDMFEEAISSRDVTGIRFSLGSGLYTTLLNTRESADLRPGMNDAGEEMLTGTQDGYLEELFNGLQDAYYRDFGVITPQGKVWIDEGLEPNECRLQLNDLRFPPLQGPGQGQFLVLSTVEQIAQLNMVGERTITSFSENEAALIQGEKDARSCREADLDVLAPLDIIQRYIIAHITRNIGAFLTTDVIKDYLSMLQGTYPDLIHAVLQRFDAAKLTRIFRNLLDEEFPVRDCFSLLEALLAVSGTTTIDLTSYKLLSPAAVNLCPVSVEKTVAEVDAVEYANYLRMAFKRTVSSRYAGGSDILYAYQLDQRIEKRIADISQPLNAEEFSQLMKAIFTESQKQNIPGVNPIILTEYNLRRSLRILLEKEYPWLFVMCYEEISSYVEPKILGEVSWD